MPVKQAKINTKFKIQSFKIPKLKFTIKPLIHLYILNLRTVGVTGNIGSLLVFKSLGNRLKLILTTAGFIKSNSNYL